ncbi:transporter substrate-binding domain-containing protein [Pseudomonas alkylphenolica]|uniref:Transporter substrate-binding domain-containing protein n=1 Tax=Pseudomonas alkylphenolica TaxID=237609 RepID=A0A6I6H8H2_9PSED|nr:amino acid ABC transporter substrate-binding protein [Pseudomonas alkylphenolica]QGW77654.1 transporter substrate-binding domain-containing protein [Pseudomonas alkylphenolica]
MKASLRRVASLLILLPALAQATTLEQVRASNTLTLGYLADFAPFSVQDGEQASGYAIDLCRKVTEQVKADLALPDLQVRFQPVALADEITAVSSGRVNLLCTPTVATLERRKQVSFSVPVYTAGVTAVVRRDAPGALLNVLNGKQAHSGPTWRATVNRGLANQTFAVVAGGVTEQWVRRQLQMLGVIATVVAVESNDAGFAAVVHGQADAFFSERMLLKNLLARHAEAEAGALMLVERIYEYAPVSMVLPRGDEDFRLLVDSVISGMYRSGEIEQAYGVYLGGASEGARRLFKLYAVPL